MNPLAGTSLQTKINQSGSLSLHRSEISRRNPFLLVSCTAILCLLAIGTCIQTEEFLRSSKQKNILITNLIAMLIQLSIFFFFEANPDWPRKRGKLNYFLTIAARVVCAGCLSFIFQEAINTIIQAMKQKVEYSVFALLDCQLLCVFYLFSLKITFINCQPVQLRIFFQTVYVCGWFLKECSNSSKDSTSVIRLSTFCLLIILRIIFEFLEDKHEKKSSLKENILSLVYDKIDQTIIILDRNKQFAYANHSLLKNFGIRSENQEKFVNFLLSQKIKYKQDNDFPLLNNNKKAQNQQEKTASETSETKARKNLLVNETISELLNSTELKDIETNSFLIDLYFHETLEGKRIINYNNRSVRINKPEDGPLAEELIIIASSAKAIPHRIKVSEINLNEVGNRKFYALVIDELNENKDLREESKNELLKQNFMTSISNEMHTALNGSLSLIDCALDDPVVKIETKDKYLVQTQACLKTLKYFINDVLDYLKPETQERIITKEKTGAREILTEVDLLMRTKCRAKGLELKTQITHLEEEFLYTDSLKLKQILINLLSTSLKFTFSGEIKLEARESLRHRDCVEFEIEDTRFLDNKISVEDKINKVEQEEDIEFRAFMAKKLAKVLAPRSIKDSIKTECRAEKGVRYTFYLDKHGAGISNMTEHENVQSPSLNSSFSLELEEKPDSFAIIEPDKQSSLPQAGKLPFFPGKALMMTLSNQPRLKISQSDNKKKEILIVDNDPLSILSMELVIKRAGYTCLKAFNGQNALEFIKDYYSKSNGPGVSLIFMDLNMPVMDGLACSRAINSLITELNIPNIPIIGCSASDSQSDIEVCKVAGMSGFISKPLDIAIIRKILLLFSEF